MARATDPHADRPAAGWRRYLYIGVPLVVVVAGAIALFWPQIQVRLWVSALHAEQPETVREARESLVASDLEDLDEQLQGRFLDPETSYLIRVRLGDILLARQRLGLVEAGLRHDDLEIRKSTLAVLADENWFASTYVDDPRYRVRETVAAWLTEGDGERAAAIELATRLGMEELTPAIRDVIRSATEADRRMDDRSAILRAAQALVALGDCEGLALLVEPARTDPDDVVRLRLMQALVRGVIGPQPPCPEAVPEATVREVVIDNLEAGKHTRAGSLVALRDNPAWAEEAKDRLRAIVDAASDPIVRRMALGALAATLGEDVARDLAIWVHDDAAVMRSEAVLAARAFLRERPPPLRLESLLVGIVRNETESELAFAQALQGLRGAAGTWLGIDEALERSAAQRGDLWQTHLQAMRTQGSSRGLARQDWAEMWFRWFSADLGVPQEDIESVAATWNAFWDAADLGDGAAAAAALEDSAYADSPLFLYERGWLETHGG